MTAANSSAPTRCTLHPGVTGVIAKAGWDAEAAEDHFFAGDGDGRGVGGGDHGDHRRALAAHEHIDSDEDRESNDDEKDYHFELLIGNLTTLFLMQLERQSRISP
jgi:hypothetical protein